MEPRDALPVLVLLVELVGINGRHRVLDARVLLLSGLRDGKKTSGARIIPVLLDLGEEHLASLG